MVDAPTETRPVSDFGQDDMVLPFAVTPLDVRGRLVRLGPAVDRIVRQHRYPEPIARLVGEAVALTALLGSSLKFEGRFQLQTRSDGVVDMLVVDFDAPDRLRAFARFDADRLAQAAGRLDSAALLGRGHLALTIEQGNDQSRYQGVVPLDGEGLEAAADRYFRQSEQIPTVVRLAVAQSVTGDGAAWRAGGFLVQFLPQSEDRRRQADLEPGDAPEGQVETAAAEDDAWTEAKALAGTIEDHELVDPTLSSERLLFRLFHERGVKVFDPQALQDACRCSRERIAGMLRSFTSAERRDMIGPEGRVGVTCEFCGIHRDFDPFEFDPPEGTA
jgi:molecular chaperone Hsp33